MGVEGTQFIRDGKPWRFGGTNCYYLHESSHQVIDAILEDASSMGLTVMRCWAFNDGTARPMALQPLPYVYPEKAYDSLDHTVFKAGQLGLKLVLPLVNNWPDYGGMQQYVAWFLGLVDDSYTENKHHDRFYTDPAIRACFLSYAEHIINRTNRYNGVRYGEDPTIMTWELANEPRNSSDTSGRGIYTWAAEVSSHIKKIAPQQLIAIGDEGLGLDASRNNEDPYSASEGNRWPELTALASIDYGTIHLYPQTWKQSRSFGIDPVAWGRQWITDHAIEGQKLGKPVVLEEFGLHIDASDGIPTAQSRDLGYEDWLNEAERSAIAGTQFWILTGLTDHGTTHVSDDGYQVLCPSPTATIIADHARNMALTPWFSRNQDK
ncbi:cellulase family glycosylhydrolase [Pseudarthrobacter sp. MDT3-28]|uniref:glycoside hydrolase 5 family protein n=1 Tax=Pseudarthrobacter raffinosi TaxID=2953651 RepID=UPI00208F32A4|nr:cellulase family glycosylhydrolase [Pseudarthrobacter sp. MDT3-28]MCO4239780.1 cellulase family glycosylhydrolase [Pseudarthrobacter sp. MDT3-28]